MRSHILPNSLAPVIVVATINLGAYIAAEATLSFLGIGLQPPAISWGIDISAALVGLRTTPHMLFFPSVFLVPDGAGVHHARRRGARRPRPEAPLSRRRNA